MSRCTVFFNLDGGLYNYPQGIATVTNCTFVANETGIKNDGMMTLTNCTIVYNSAFSTGGTGGVFNSGSGTLHIHNSVVANNLVEDPTRAPEDVRGVFLSDGYNFIGAFNTGQASGFSTANHDQFGSMASPADPLFGRLR